jgi:hypothetical protein
VDHFDAVIQGTTESSLADFIEQGTDIPEGSSMLVELSTFVKTSAECNIRKIFSIYGYLEGISTVATNTVLSGMLNASFGPRIFSRTEDITYAGKIYAQFRIKEFLNVPAEDVIEAVDLIAGLGDSSTAIADWNDDAADLLWGSTPSPYISLTLGVGDNDGIIEAATYTDLEVLEMIGNVQN